MHCRSYFCIYGLPTYCSWNPVQLLRAYRCRSRNPVYTVVTSLPCRAPPRLLASLPPYCLASPNLPSPRFFCLADYSLVGRHTYSLDAHLPTTYMKAPPSFPLPPSISLASIFPRYRLARGSSPSQAKIILYTLIYLLTSLIYLLRPATHDPVCKEP